MENWDEYDLFAEASLAEICEHFVDLLYQQFIDGGQSKALLRAQESLRTMRDYSGFAGTPNSACSKLVAKLRADFPDQEHDLLVAIATRYLDKMREVATLRNLNTSVIAV